MLKKIALKNFRQHTDKVIDFKDGFNLIRGQNEAGKSTVLAAAAYALYGSRSLPESLEQVVTWGEPVNSLKVTLDFEFAGVDYNITRGKSGAELRFGSELITGQTETVKFIENLFGINADVASKLMLANQGTIRGALEGGPKATMELIESLADFDIIENLIEKIQDKLPTGNTKIVEDRLKTFEANLQEEPVKPNVEEAEQQVATLEKQIQATADELEKAQAALKEMQPDMDRFVDLSLKTGSARVAQMNWPEKQAKLLADVAAAEKAMVGSLLPDEKLAEIKALLEKEANFNDLQVIYAKVGNLPVPEVEWEGDLESFLAHKKQVADDLVAARQAQADLQADEKVLKAKRITESFCGLCGKDLSEVPEVVTKNTAIDKELQDLEAKLAAARLRVVELIAAQNDLNEVLTTSHTLIEKYSDYLKVDKNFVPWRVKWIAEVPSKPDTTQAKAELAAHQAEQTRLLKAQGALDQVRKTLQTEQAAYEKAIEILAELGPEYERLSSTVVEPFSLAKEKVAKSEETLKGLNNALREARLNLREQLADYTAKKSAYDSAKAGAKVAQEELEQMNFNNALIKKIRSARPKIADKLWTVVLSAVSHYFSNIRGKNSLVTKEAGGFLVDGHPVTGLSGSTLDALGLAIRLSLTKTFLPNVRFIVLDEAGAACDDQRETNMLGVLATCDFDQVLHVSHNDLGDAFASNVIQL